MIEKEYIKSVTKIMMKAEHDIAEYSTRGRSKIRYTKGMISDYAKQGEKYLDLHQNRLLIIGRAPGKMNNVDEKDCLFQSKEKFLLDKEIEAQIIKERKDDLGWIAQKNGGTIRIGKKPFFKLAGDVITKLLPESCFKSDIDWYQYIAKTNLYNITYKDGGNPNKALRDAQRSSMIDMLALNIEYLNPTHILFITGEWEELFVTDLKSMFCNKKVARVARPERADKTKIYKIINEEFQIDLR